MLTKNKISELLGNIHFEDNKTDIISDGSVKNIVFKIVLNCKYTILVKNYSNSLMGSQKNNSKSLI